MVKNGLISYMLIRFVMLFVLLCGIWFVICGLLFYGEFVVFVLLMNVLFCLIDKINVIIEMYLRGIVGFKSFMEILEMEFDIKDVLYVRYVFGLKGNICYDYVLFGYEENNLVLFGINLFIYVGEIVVFVGFLGVGKLMLISLFLCFYELFEGVIFIDGIDIKDMMLLFLWG